MVCVSSLRANLALTLLLHSARRRAQGGAGVIAVLLRLLRHGAACVPRGGGGGTGLTDGLGQHGVDARRASAPSLQDDDGRRLVNFMQAWH
jgi:hypothetical protein